jgi:ferredoxin
LEHDLPICDAHHHLWEYPGNVYLGKDLIEDINGHNIAQAVVVEAWGRNVRSGGKMKEPAEQTALAVAESNRYPGRTRIAGGIVGYADLMAGKAVENMRLPTVGERGPIDEEKAREIIEYAYEHGVNYFGTAYGYHGGESERFVGKVLNQYPRERWHLATKMPGHMMRFSNGRFEFSGYLTGQKSASPAALFEQQLEKCGVDASFENPFILHFTLDAMKEAELPFACLACGDCKELCPQGIDIPDIMRRFAETIANMPKMGPPPRPEKPAGSAK